MKTSLVSFYENAFRVVGSLLSQYLTSPRPSYQEHSTLTIEQLESTLKPCDLLLVEGNSRISTAIKYLTQSTWSHICICTPDNRGKLQLIEADLNRGVIVSPLDKYIEFNVRICRPIKLSDLDTQSIINFVEGNIGHQYDKKNIFDLMRYLLPTPPVPSRFRRKLIAFGSGDPTRAICSTLIAQAFQSVKYPILPIKINTPSSEHPPETHSLLPKVDIFTSRHFSHFTPRDFDLSPYFEVVKPTIKNDFDYKQLRWQAPSE